MSEVRIIMEPTVIPVAEMGFIEEGLEDLVDYLQDRRPECGVAWDYENPPSSILPHDGLSSHTGRGLTHNEMLVEMAGRGCYYSYGEKAGRGTNEAYVDRLLGQPGKIPHSSVFYHAKFTFFIAGVSRRVSHELIRHYVGADRTEEGSPSQESTRYTYHPGWFTAHPHVVDAGGRGLDFFKDSMVLAYTRYRQFIREETQLFESREGKEPKGMDRKRIYEAAAQLLPGAAATSFYWTTNPAALAKLFKERCDDASDREIQRLACKWRDIAYFRWPNLFAESNPNRSK